MSGYGLRQVTLREIERNAVEIITDADDIRHWENAHDFYQVGAIYYSAKRINTYVTVQAGDEIFYFEVIHHPAQPNDLVGHPTYRHKIYGQDLKHFTGISTTYSSIDDANSTFCRVTFSYHFGYSGPNADLHDVRFQYGQLDWANLQNRIFTDELGTDYFALTIDQTEAAQFVALRLRPTELLRRLDNVHRQYQEERGI